jgi:hypothetical protein
VMVMAGGVDWGGSVLCIWGATTCWS